MTQVNFLRPRLPSRELRQRRRLQYGLLMLGVLLAACLAGYGGIRRAARLAAAELAAAQARLAATAGRVERWQAIQDEARRLGDRLEALGAIPAQEVRFAALLADVAGACTGICRLTEVALDPENGLTLRATAGSHTAAAECVERLRALPQVAGVELRSSVRGEETGEVRFEVVGTLAGEGGQGR